MLRNLCRDFHPRCPPLNPALVPSWKWDGCSSENHSNANDAPFLTSSISLLQNICNSFANAFAEFFFEQNCVLLPGIYLTLQISICTTVLQPRSVCSVYASVIIRTWTPHRRQKHHLNSFHLRCFRYILVLAWRDHVIYPSVWKQQAHRHWCRRWGCRGCNCTPKSFDIVKIRAKSHKIRENPLNSGTFWTQMALNTLWFENNGARIDMKSIFLGGHCFEVFSGRFGSIRAKFLRTPKNLPAPAPVLTGPHHHHRTSALLTSSHMNSFDGACMPEDDCLPKQTFSVTHCSFLTLKFRPTSREP